MINLIVIAGFALILTGNPKCTCLPITVKTNYEQSTLVFRGKVLVVDTLKQFDDNLPKGAFRELHMATLKVDKFYKGQTSDDTIKVITGDGHGDCGYNFIPRMKIIVYAIDRNYSIIDSTILPSLDVIVSERRYLYTDYCDRTTSGISKEDSLLNEFLAHGKTLEN